MKIPATMTEQVEYIQSLDISYRTLHPAIIIKNNQNSDIIQVPFSSMISKYKDLMSTIVVSLDLDEVDQEKYKFKPKLVSDELYGTTELWDQILLLNNAYSMIDFKPKTLYFYDPSQFKRYINEIMLLENN